MKGPLQISNETRKALKYLCNIVERSSSEEEHHWFQYAPQRLQNAIQRAVEAFREDERRAQATTTTEREGTPPEGGAAWRRHGGATRTTQTRRSGQTRGSTDGHQATTPALARTAPREHRRGYSPHGDTTLTRRGSGAGRL